VYCRLIGTYGDPASPEALHTAIRLLRTTRLYNQVFFGTEEAVSCLRFDEASGGNDGMFFGLKHL
jgi:hypothetical protein